LKLIDIWERGNTFPIAMLSGFKQKLTGPVPKGKALQSPVAIEMRKTNRKSISDTMFFL
jgi:hypothetical protein